MKIKHVLWMALSVVITIGAVKVFSGNDRPVVIINEVEFSEYELDKWMDKALRRSGIADTSAINEAIGAFLDRAYIIADMYANGYADDDSIKIKLRTMERAIITQHDGLLFKHLYGEQEITDGDIDKYNREIEKKLHVELIQFDSMAQYDSLDAAAYTGAELTEIQQADGVEIYNTVIDWPYGNLFKWRAVICGMSIGDIYGPMVADNGVYVLKIDDITVRKANGLVDNGELIRMQYYNCGISAYKSDVLDLADIWWNRTACAKFYQRLKENQIRYLINCEWIDDILHDELFSYMYKDARITVRVKDFADYYNSLMIRWRIKGADKIYECCRAMVIEQYAYDHAVQLGLTTTMEFQMDRLNYHRSLLYSCFLNTVLLDEISIDQAETEAFYAVHRDEFREGSDMVVSEFIFNTFEGAMNGTILLNQHQDNEDIVGVLLDKFDMESCDFEKRCSFDDTRYSHAALDRLFQLVDMSVTEPFDIGDGQFAVYLKHSESGERICGFREVRDDIEKQLVSEKRDQLKAERIEQFKAKYRVTNRIDPAKYYRMIR